jgi:hypothetical protein
MLGLAAFDTAIVGRYAQSMRITDAKVVDRFHVSVRFNDGVSGVVDLSHLAGRGVFRAWEQAGVFERLSVTFEGALQWPSACLRLAGWMISAA